MKRRQGPRCPRHRWTPAEEALMCARYPDEPSSAIAAELGLELHQVYAKAAALRLNKSEAFYAGDHNCRLKKGSQVGKATQFAAGQVPHNKGKKMETRGRMAETQFKKGDRSGRAAQLWQPIGTERVTAEGYRQRKVRDTGYTPSDYVEVHRLLWEEHHGPIPPKHLVVFKNKDRADIRIENLEMITQAEQMRRNSLHTRYPKEICQAIQLKNQVVRQINRRTQLEKQD